MVHAPLSFHRGSRGSPHWYARWVEAFQAENIDTEIFRRDTLPMERINAASPAKEVARGHGVKAVFAERVFASEQLELALVNLDHQRILAAANRAIAGRQLGKIGLDLEANQSAMTTAPVFPGRSH
jgi:hypothetical protein